jgi:DNA-directed RNA polymerase specialized sigma54-like protein
MPTQDQLESAVKRACDQLIARDHALFERNVNERSLSHKFAIYLQQEVENWREGWEVDCEFNRDAQDTGEDYAKQLNLIDKLETFTTDVHDENATTVFPDVIIHKRGPGNNLLVVEIKKDTAPSKSIAFDKKDKLPAYVSQLDYQAAVFILLHMNKLDCEVTWMKRFS